MTLVASELAARRKDVDDYLEMLRRAEEAIELGAPESKLIGDAVEVMRASAYIVAYNVVEHVFRVAMKSIRSELMNGAVTYSDASHSWRSDFLRLSLLDALRKGVNHDGFLEQIDEMFWAASPALAWQGDRLGAINLQGNIGFKEIEDMRRKLNLRWKLPANVGTSQDLFTIKDRRNKLAHGEMTFSEVGKNLTAADLKSSFDRAFVHLKLFAVAMDGYRINQKWKRDLTKPRTWQGPA